MSECNKQVAEGDTNNNTNDVFNCHVLSDFPYSPDEESGKRTRHLGERVNGNTRPSS